MCGAWLNRSAYGSVGGTGLRPRVDRARPARARSSAGNARRPARRVVGCALRQRTGGSRSTTAGVRVLRPSSPRSRACHRLSRWRSRGRSPGARMRAAGRGSHRFGRPRRGADRTARAVGPRLGGGDRRAARRRLRSPREVRPRTRGGATRLRRAGPSEKTGHEHAVAEELGHGLGIRTTLGWEPCALGVLVRRPRDGVARQPWARGRLRGRRAAGRRRARWGFGWRSPRRRGRRCCRRGALAGSRR